MMKFYEKMWFAVLMLVMFFPAGIFLIWKYEHFNRVVRVGITILMVVLFVFGVGSGRNEIKEDIKETQKENTLEGISLKEDTIEEEENKKEEYKPLTRDDFNESTITFDNLVRNPEDYLFEMVSYTGEILQVIDGYDFVQYRVAINGDVYQTILAEISKSKLSQNLLERDIVKVYGYSTGMFTYTTVLGATKQVPGILVEMIDLQE